MEEIKVLSPNFEPIMYSPLQLSRKYANFFWQAVNSKGHGVHSPFVFDFIKFVKNDRQQYASYSAIEPIRKRLLQSKAEIEVEDFGAGSTVLKTKKRVVSKMAASSLKPRRFAQLLHRIVQCYQPKTIVELGTSFAVTTAYLATANQNSTVFTLEGSPAIAAIARKNFEQLSLSNIRLIEGSFEKTLDPLLASLDSVDLAFIDGNHKKMPTLEYFEKFLAKSHNDTILIFDDIHWSKEMEEAWEQIKQHPSVTLSLDLFFIGIIFFKTEFKVKQQFKLRL